MGLIRNRFIRPFGLLSDIAMVAAAGARVARRSTASGTSDRPDIIEWFLVAGAAVRIFRRLRRVRRRRRLVKAGPASG